MTHIVLCEQLEFIGFVLLCVFQESSNEIQERQQGLRTLKAATVIPQVWHGVLIFIPGMHRKDLLF